MERVTGIEPASLGWKPKVIPLYDTRLVGRGGVEPPQSQTADLQSVGLATCSASPYCVSILSQIRP